MPPRSRREFLALAAATAATALIPAQRSRAALRPLRPLRPLRRPDDADLYFDWVRAGPKDWLAKGDGGNSLLLLADNAATLIDCKNAPFGAGLRREASSRGQPLRQVINTHHHADHTGGNHAFVKDLPILAHADCKARVANQLSRYIAQNKEAAFRLEPAADANPKKADAIAKVRQEVLAYHNHVTSLTPADFEPTQTMRDSHDLEIGGLKISLRHFGPGHTDNDVAVHIPSRNLIHTGDLLFNRIFPVIDLQGGATTRGWQNSLKQLIALCDDKTTVVPGHGEIANAAALREQLEFFDKLRDMVAKAMKKGKTRSEVMQLSPDAFPGYTGSNWSMTLRGMFEELKAQSSK